MEAIYRTCYGMKNQWHSTEGILVSKRYYVYKLIDDSTDTSASLFHGQVEIPEQTDQQTMNDGDARAMVADAVIKHLIRSKHRPNFSHIEFCELNGQDDPRLHGETDGGAFDWQRCTPDELELKLSEED